ncbi:MAG TPA: energy-coupling factor transporter transmembrane component T [Bryobacteraceae bacterium]|nr:energy-coupling factor transporter transmembrane component T [Bryobacteraceae bacterium]
MRHAQVERWSLGDSVIHRRHAAAKILVTLVLLISIATLTGDALAACGLYLALLLLGGVASRLPVLSLLRAAAAVLPFALCFALVSALAGEPARAVMLIVRGYLSGLAAVLLIATTPMPDLIAGLDWLRAPAFVLQVMQFLYRYLIVLMGEAGAIRQASLARAGSIRNLQFRQAAAAIAVLFARTWSRALVIHQAMVSRGFEGRIPVLRRKSFRLPDIGFAAGVALLIAGLRVALG